MKWPGFENAQNGLAPGAVSLNLPFITAFEAARKTYRYGHMRNAANDVRPAGQLGEIHADLKVVQQQILCKRLLFLRAAVDSWPARAAASSQGPCRH